VIYAEPFTFSADTAAKLEAMGYKFKEQAPWGAAEAILVAPPALAAGADRRDRRFRPRQPPGAGPSLRCQ
jgi:Gamma-glutamyltransferase